MTGNPLSGRRLTSATIAVLIAAAVATAYFIFDPAHSPLAPKCIFHLITGWSCPGCGSQRALHALLHLQLADALRYNALFVVSLPFIALLAFAEMKRKSLPGLYERFNSGIIITAVVIILVAWGIVRNFLHI